MTAPIRACLQLLLAFFLTGSAAYAQAPTWQAALALQAPSFQPASTKLIETDAAGNVFMAGHFTGSITLGSTQLTSSGATDVFVAKWSPATNDFVWALRAGGAGSEYPYGLALSGSEVYLTGAFDGANAAFGSRTLSSAGADDVFVTKISDTGASAAFTWAERAGGPGYDSSMGIGVNSTGVYLTGSSGGAAAFGATILGGNGFVARLSDSGPTASFAWAMATDAVPNALALSGGHIYLTGSFSAAVAFGSTTLASSGSQDVFLAKLSDTGVGGAYAWALRAGGSSADEALALAVSGSSIYLTGTFRGAAATFGSATLASNGENDAFIAKVADAGASGAFVWGQRLGNEGDDNAYHIVAKGSSLYICGSFNSGILEVGPSRFANTSVRNDLFLARLTDTGLSGAFMWGLKAGGSGNDYGYALAVSGTRVYLAGSVVLSAGFGAIFLSSTSNPISSSSTGFLAFLTDAAGLALSPAAPGASLSLSPNPARQQVTVQLPAAAGLPATLTLTDTVGRVVRQQRVPARAVSIVLQLEGLPAGLYAVRCGPATARLVVE